MAMFETIKAAGGWGSGRSLVAALQAVARNFGLLEPSIKTSAAADYRPILGDKFIKRTNAGAQTVTIAAVASVVGGVAVSNFVAGTVIDVEQNGAGALTIVAGGGVTINKLATKTLVAAGRYGIVRLRYEGADVWNASGDLTVA